MKNILIRSYPCIIFIELNNFYPLMNRRDEKETTPKKSADPDQGYLLDKNGKASDADDSDSGNNF